MLNDDSGSRISKKGLIDSSCTYTPACGADSGGLSLYGKVEVFLTKTDVSIRH